MANAQPLINDLVDQENESGALSVNSSMRNIAYWESTLFSNVYLRNDLKRDFSEKWEKDYDDQVFDTEGNTVKRGFYHFYNEFRNISNSLRGLSQKKLSETDTITKIIVPLIDALGWYDKCSNNVEEPFAAETSFTVKATPKNKTYRTDMILVDEPQEAGFISDSDDSETRKKEGRQYCIAPLEAKYWNRIVDREKSNLSEDKKRANKAGDDTGLSTSFNDQILNYMNILHRKWGIVTDGNIWRLLNSEISGESAQRCFEFRIESLLDQEAKIESGQIDEAEFMENAKYFYLFFGKASFVKDELGKIFLDEVLKESRKYIDSIEEDLKDRFISAMNITCDGLLRSAQNIGTIKVPTNDDLKLIRTVAESHLFNILFIKSCEARSILPAKSPSYYDISLTGIFDRISVFEPEKYTSKTEKEYFDKKLSNSLKLHNYKSSGTALYKNLIRLTDVIHHGANRDDFGFEIKGFKESVFSDEEWSFAKKHSLTDEEMVRVFFELGYSKASASIQRNYQQIPYNYFTPRQLGSIYESFLEYKLDIAKEPMVYVKKGKYKQWIKLTASIQRGLKGHEPIVKPGQACFTPDNTERKATGSYYTPDYIVQYIVRETLGPICLGKTSDEILRIKICDPAMGSGHFLIAALNYLTSSYVAALADEVTKEGLPTKEESMRLVLDKCIFGADINSRAVKLAKMSLWLESAHWGSKLERLDDQIRCCDSLMVKELWPDYPQLNKEGFDAVLGNPPYLGEKGNKDYFQKVRLGKMSSYYQRRMDLFYFFFHLGLDLLKKEGRLGYISTNYFITASEATKLRNDLKNRSSITHLINFNEYKIFKSAMGQHNIITICERGAIDAPAFVYEFNQKGFCEQAQFLESIAGKTSPELKQSEIFDGDQAFIRTSIDHSSLEDASIFKKMKMANFSLKDICEMTTGIQTGADKISPKHIKRYPSSNYNKGEGIFVLTKSESIAKGIDSSKFLRPWFKNSDIKQFKASSKSNNQVIYIGDTGDTQKIEKDLFKHFERYKKLLTDRLSVCKANEFQWNIVGKWIGRGEYYLLFYPRKEHFFKGEKIVVPQRSTLNTFAYTTGDWFGSVDIYFLKERDDSEIPLKVLLALLNSKTYYYYLYHKGKRKGGNLELYLKPLSQLPVPKVEIDIQKKITVECEKLIKNGIDSKIHDVIEKYIYDIFKFSKKEIEEIENLYSNRKSKKVKVELDGKSKKVA